MKRVVVVYPAWYGNTYGEKKVEDGPKKGWFYTPEKRKEMWLHGPTIKNPDHLMVEDDNGWVHVVNKKIVKEQEGV